MVRWISRLDLVLNVFLQQGQLLLIVKARDKDDKEGGENDKMMKVNFIILIDTSGVEFVMITEPPGIDIAGVPLVDIRIRML